jgi:hypothetical protein
MQFSSEVIREHRKEFQSLSGSMAPRPAVAAFMAIAPDIKPVTFLEWDEPGHKGGSKWILAGLSNCWLVLVVATAPKTWSWQDQTKPDGATVTAHRVPLRRVTAVRLEDVDADLNRPFDLGELVGSARWVIELDSGDTVSINGGADSRAEERAASFCLSLFERVSD